MKSYFDLLKIYPLSVLLKAGFCEIKRKLWSEFICNSYSQDGEDKIIEKIINKKRGKYLEIGAYHPTRLSNTYRFYKSGWRGVVVEPNPEVEEIFRRIRPRDRFLGIGISDKNQKLKYYQFYIPALNTFSKSEAEKSQKMGHKLKEVGTVTTKSIRNIVGEYFDFVSIDTEGFDEMILKNWPWNKFKPGVICVEAQNNRVKNILVKNGYEIVFENKINIVYKSRPC